MAKYKLIKIYPKSPPLGTIVEVGNDGYLTYRMRNDYNREMTSIHESVLTEYSEFWEEITKKPLFTTEDGVDIYQGDKFYFISKTFNDLKCAIENYAHNGYWKHEDMKTFSTKEKAEEYILMNKPCLSINDLVTKSTHGVLIEELRKIVKSKL